MLGVIVLMKLFINKNLWDVERIRQPVVVPERDSLGTGYCCEMVDWIMIKRLSARKIESSDEPYAIQVTIEADC